MHGHRAHPPGTYSGVGEIKPTQMKQSEDSDKLQEKKEFREGRIKGPM